METMKLNSKQSLANKYGMRWLNIVREKRKQQEELDFYNQP